MRASPSQVASASWRQSNMTVVPRNSKRWITVVLFIGIVVTQLRYVSKFHYQLLRFSGMIEMSDIASNTFPPSTTTTTTTATSRPLDVKHGFGACLMVKDDNDLLYEWIAYHYTVVSLRHIVIGIDVGSLQNVSNVLSRWDNANFTSHHQLRYWILQPEEFMYRHHRDHNGKGPMLSYNNIVPTRRSTDWKQIHHHELVERQKGFVTVCSEILKTAGVAWTLYIDSDEFIAWNPLSDDEDVQLQTNIRQRNVMNNRSYTIRKQFAASNTRYTAGRNASQNWNYYDRIRQLQNQQNLPECYTMPRLLVGALENRTCPERYGVSKVQQLARRQLGNDRFMHMSTLRYFQHARKGDFSRSKYGKVMMDLTRIDMETIQTVTPRNIHRPYTEHCVAAGGVYFPNSYFFILHYIGSWERYISRGSNDRRRNRREWEHRAYVDDENMSACDSTVHRWLVQFQQLVGEDRTTYLLGSG